MYMGCCNFIAVGLLSSQVVLLQVLIKCFPNPATPHGTVSFFFHSSNQCQRVPGMGAPNSWVAGLGEFARHGGAWCSIWGWFDTVEAHRYHWHPLNILVRHLFKQSFGRVHVFQKQIAIKLPKIPIVAATSEESTVTWFIIFFFTGESSWVQR